jgi:hypothetical protein
MSCTPVLTVLEQTYGSDEWGSYSIVEVKEDKKDLVSSELPVTLILHQGKLTTKRKLYAVFWIRIEFNADPNPDPAFKLNEHLAERKVDEDNKKVDGNNC